jgi:hypothetical protein
MNGQICFATKNKNVSVLVENGNVSEHKIYETGSLFTKLSFFNTDGSDMTEEEYNQFYDENTELIDFIADLEIEI